MDKRVDFYGGLGVVALIVTPLAAALLFGWELFDYLAGRQLPWALAVIGGMAGMAALECVGIYAGHVGMDFMRRRDWRGVIAAAAMLFYVWLGWSKVPEYGEVFVLAAFMYVLVALRAEVVGLDGAVAVQERDEVVWKRDMLREGRLLKHEERLAEIAAHAAQETQKTQDAPQSVRSASLYECSCGKVYTSPQGYSAHTRWCAIYKAQVVEGLPTVGATANGHGGD